MKYLLQPWEHISIVKLEARVVVTYVYHNDIGAQYHVISEL